jgi:hypothetical protein
LRVWGTARKDTRIYRPRPYDAGSLKLDARPQKAELGNHLRQATTSNVRAQWDLKRASDARDDEFGRGQEHEGKTLTYWVLTVRGDYKSDVEVGLSKL